MADQEMAEHDGAEYDGAEQDVRTPGSTGPVAMIRSEEQLRVSTRRVPARRARLERFEVTEMQTITVPVIREDVRIVYEPLENDTLENPTDVAATVGGADGAADSGVGSPVWVLMQERVVVTKERVPVETVRMVIDTVTESRSVTEQVRAEQVTLQTTPLHPQHVSVADPVVDGQQGALLEPAAGDAPGGAA